MKTLAQLAFEAEIRGDGETPISGLSADSRKVGPGFLFAALPGVKADGAQFIPQALAKGAAAVLVGDESLCPGGDVACLVAGDPRRALALAAAGFYENQPATIIAVTGTNGKTSVASFVRQIWAALGYRAASLGTVGVEIEGGGGAYEHWPLGHTTPDPVEIHAKLARLAAGGVTHLALEASSHGLEQRRLDGVRLRAAGFTNITQDHLDYHKDMDDYFACKLRLFRELLPSGAGVVFDADIKGAEKVAEIAQGCNLPIIPVGEKGAGLRMENLALKPTGVNFHVEHEGELYDVDTALIGDFQASNLLVAAGLVMAAGERWADIWKLLGGIRGAKGRMELAGRIGEGDDAVPVLVDYAHTPDALENAINSLKAVTNKDGRLIVVFGCGGDRDQGKRPLMGAIAQKLADIAIVTDDNPRSEDPAAIRAAILAAAPDAMEIGDRQQAIAEAVRMARPGDSILVAGKGHEEGQKVGDEVLPFLDHDAVRKAIELREAAS